MKIIFDKLLYAGIGSRDTPLEVMGLMRKIGLAMRQRGWRLSTGEARGADKAFRDAAGPVKRVFTAKGTKPGWFHKVLNEVLWEHENLDWADDYVKGLLLRSTQQILGENGDEPVSLVVCWTPRMDPCHRNSGGTRYGCRVAMLRGIPVFNLNHYLQAKAITSLIGVVW